MALQISAPCRSRVLFFFLLFPCFLVLRANRTLHTCTTMIRERVFFFPSALCVPWSRLSSFCFSPLCFMLQRASATVTSVLSVCVLQGVLLSPAFLLLSGLLVSLRPHGFSGKTAERLRRFPSRLVSHLYLSSFLVVCFVLAATHTQLETRPVISRRRSG